MKLANFIFILTLLIFSCTTVPELAKEIVKIVPEIEKEAIRNLIDQYESSLVNGSTDGATKVFANDAVFMPDNGNAAIGEDAIRGNFQSLSDPNGNINISFNIQEITVLGDFAIVWSENSGKSTDAESGEEIPFNSKSFFVLKKGDDNEWKIFRYIFNSSPTDSNWNYEMLM